MKTLHLMTQRGQPYGSQRKCCEVCGLMMVARPPEFWSSHNWTDDPDLYQNYPASKDQPELRICSAHHQSPEKRTNGGDTPP